MSNAIYGKTMENVRLRTDIKLASKWEGRYGAKNLISRPNFKKRTIFNENLVAIELERTEVVLNKPIIIGMNILDISKIVMYDYHYNYMKKKYGNNCQVLYTDTDSFIYNIKCDDFYHDMRLDQNKYDTSDFDPNNVYKISLLNKKIPGLMKDENNGLIMTNFIGLRSKMYCIKVNNTKVIKKAKGVKNYVIKNKLNYNDYLNCIQTNCEIFKPQNTIRSKLHNI